MIPSDERAVAGDFTQRARRLTTRWNEPGMLRQKHELVAMCVIRWAGE